MGLKPFDSFILELKAEKETDKKIQAVFLYVDSLFKKGEFETVDSLFTYLLEHVDWLSLDLDVMASFLTISIPAKDKLPNRKVFFEKIWKFLKDDPDSDMLYKIFS